MMSVDPIADAMTRIKNAEHAGKREVVVTPVSNLLREILSIMRKQGYIGDYEIIDDGKGGIAKIKLLGKINACGAIKPRFSVGKFDFEKFEKRYLPAKNFGIMIISTPQGVMTHEEAKQKGIGGILLAYVW